MTVIPIPSTTGGNHEGRSPAGTGRGHDDSRSLAHLGPLIHQLIARDLIYQSAEGAFMLRDDIQRLLAEKYLTLPPGEPEIFVGRKCQHCYRITVTRVVDGSRICGDCVRGDEPAAPLHPFEPSVREYMPRPHWPRRGHRAAS
jgi:hypothetical protein